MFIQGPGAAYFLVAAAVGTAATILLIRLMSAIAPSIGLVDLPDARKSHQGAVPLVGGVSLCAAYLAVAVFLLPIGDAFWPFVTGVALLAVSGLLDDLFELSPKVRLVLQVMAALAVIVGMNLQLHSLGDLLGFGNVELSALAGFLFTAFCIVSLVNGLNMLDGLDGLAGGVAAIMLGAFIVAGVAMDLASQVAHLAVFLSCLLGFLVLHNAQSPLRRKLVFMGDAGSMVLGFLLACTAISLANEPAANSMYPITAVWILGLVVLDTISTVVRRALQGRSPLSPGRDHLHHLLLELGVPAPRVVRILYLAAAAMAVIGLAAWFLSVPEYLLTIAFAAVSLLYYAGVSYGWRAARRRRNVVLPFNPQRAESVVVVNGLEPEELDARAG